MKQRLVLIGSILCVALIILIPHVAAKSAQETIGLCLQSVIPSLFPFIFLTTLIASRCDLLTNPLLRYLGRITAIPEGCESILLLGWLGGYPIGAKSVYENYKTGQLTRQSAVRMLGYCNNAGPSFIFGVLMFNFTRPAYLWLLWIIQILSSLITGILLPKKNSPQPAAPMIRRTSVNQALHSSILAIATICGWIVIFRIVISYLEILIAHKSPALITVMVTGLFELTNGCYVLKAIPNEAHRFLICNAMLTFGGLCVALQTKSVVKELGFGMYFPGKLLQTCISTILSFLCSLLFF